MPSVAVPGIYVSEQRYALNSLKIESRSLAAFVGFAERGPLHEPVLVRSFDEYLNRFGGFDSAGFLPYSAYGFFKCGGAECVIVRVADETEAKRAAAELKCAAGTLRLEAKSPGHWGNGISVRVWHDDERGAPPVACDSEEGLWAEFPGHPYEAGDVLRFSLYGRTFYRGLRFVEGDRVRFDKPLKLLASAEGTGERVTVARVFYSMNVVCGKKRETYVHLSPNPASSRWGVRHVNERSSLCSIAESKGGNLPLPVFSALANGGTDGIADLKASDFIGHFRGIGDYRGIGCLESRDDIALIAAPDAGWLRERAGHDKGSRDDAFNAVQEALVLQAERFPGRFAVLDAPDGRDFEDIARWADRIDSANAAAYYPSIDVIDPLDPAGFRTVRVPPSGAVCGCIAATDSDKGVFHAPANVTVQGAAGVAYRVSDGEYEALYGAGVNLLKYFPGKGIKIWGARTLSSDPEWRYLNVRRTFSRITQSVKTGTQWAVFEPNDKNLRKRLVRQVSGFLLDLWMEGYLAGSTAEQGFYVRCDEELNPPSNVDAGILTFEIGIAIVKPVEFFRITITAEKEGASVYIQE